MAASLTEQRSLEVVIDTGIHSCIMLLPAAIIYVQSENQAHLSLSVTE